MALTRITKGVIKPNENYDTHDIVSTGIVTAVGLDINGNADVSGNFSVGGVLTYEDVTSIDSVGIITAQKGIHVGAGISVVGVGTFGSLDISGDIDVDGHTNLDNISIAGVTTFSGNVHLPTNVRLRIGNSNELDIYQQGNNTFILNNDDTFVIGQQGSGADHAMRIYGGSEFELKHMYSNGGQTSSFKSVRGGAFTLYHAGGNSPSADQIRLETTSTGLNFPRDIDVDGHTNLDNVSIAGVTTITGTLGSGDITITSNQPKLSLTDSSNDPDWSVKNANGNFAINDETAGATRFSINSSNGVEFHMHAVPSADSTYDLGLTGTRWRNVYADTLYGAGSNITALNGSNIASGTVPVARIGTGTKNTSTFYRGDGTFQVVSTDLVGDTSPQLGGDLDVNGKKIKFPDLTGSVNNILYFGTGDDLLIYHLNDVNYIQCENSRTLRIQQWTGSGNETLANFIPNGAVELYHNNVKKFETGADRVNVTGHVVITDGSRIYITNGFGNGAASIRNEAANTAGNMVFTTRTAGGSDTSRAMFTTDGHFIPYANNTYDLGNTSTRWRNAYVNDMHFSNEGSSNSVDGTWGDWTLQEGEDKIFMINNRTGKKYSLKMEEE